MTAELLIVEDHGLMARSLATALRQEADVAVTVAEPDVADGLLPLVDDRTPDLVLLDLDLGSMGNGLSLIEPIRDRGAEVVVVTGVTDPVRHAECVEAGAAGIIRKSASFDDMLTSVQTVLEGNALLTKNERDEHLARLREHRTREAERTADLDRLSQREAEVLGSLMRGRSVGDIAEQAVVSESTVRTQVRAILQKLDVNSQLRAVARAREAGWEPPPER